MQQEIKFMPKLKIKLVADYDFQTINAHNMKMLIKVVAEESNNIIPEQYKYCHLITILDCSGSMSGIKLHQMQSSMKMLVNELLPQDYLTIITFNNKAQIVFDGKIEETKARIVHYIKETGKYIDNLPQRVRDKLALEKRNALKNIKELFITEKTFIDNMVKLKEFFYNDQGTLKDDILVDNKKLNADEKETLKSLLAPFKELRSSPLLLAVENIDPVTYDDFEDLIKRANNALSDKNVKVMTDHLTKCSVAYNRLIYFIKHLENKNKKINQLAGQKINYQSCAARD